MQAPSMAPLMDDNALVILRQPEPEFYKDEGALQGAQTVTLRPDAACALPLPQAARATRC